MDAMAGDGEVAQLMVAAAAEAVEVSCTPLLVVAAVHLEVVCWPPLRLAEEAEARRKSPPLLTARVGITQGQWARLGYCMDPL
jgi:hypothetical protein